MKKEENCAQVEPRGKGLAVGNGRLGVERILVVTHRPWLVGAQAAKLEARIGVELLRTEQRLTKPSAGDRFLVGFPFSRGFCYSGPVGTSLEPHIHSQRSSSVVELLWSSICDKTRRRRLFRGHNTFFKGFH